MEKETTLFYQRL